MSISLYSLLKADEKQVRKVVTKELKSLGYSPVVTDDFIYAEGSVPVMLLAHYDTVPKPPKWVNRKGNILSAKKGLGADDRAGIFAILNTIEKAHCHVLFTGGEECGGIGAEAFAKSGIMPEVNYCIQLDRRGTNDAVYYDGDNEEFEEYITSHGWKTAIGSYTDICTVCPAIGVMGVNLSIGYENEHRHNETLDVEVMMKNAERVLELLDGPKFEWKEIPHTAWYGGGYWGRLWSGYYDRDYYGDVYDGISDGTGSLHGWTLQDELRGGCFYYSDSVQTYTISYCDGGDIAQDYSIGRSDVEAVGFFLAQHESLTYSDILDIVPGIAPDDYID